MTGFFSTGMDFTASSTESIVEIVIAFTPPVLVLVSAMTGVLAGGALPVAATMTSVPAMSALAGARLEVLSSWVLVSDLAAHGGAAVEVDQTPWTFTVAAFTVAAGGHVGLYTDVNVVVFPGSTGQFSTAGSEWTYTTQRTLIQMAMHAAAPAIAGGRIVVNAVVTIEPYDHGPVARPHGVQTQVIMS